MATKGQATRERILEVAEALVLDQGYAGTSIDDIIGAAGLTKGAFFYHFQGKAELARALAERYWEADFALMKDLAARARALADDPVQAMFLFFKLFEEHIAGLGAVPPGCLFASYVYESRQFDPSINSFVETGFRQWEALMEALFAEAIATRPPPGDLTAADLSRMAVAVIEGGFILSRSYGDPVLLARQSQTFRRLLQALFAPGTP